MTFFIGLGGQKCGSTWLYKYLAENTTARMLPIKELSWFTEKTGETSFYNAHFREQAAAIVARSKSKGTVLTEKQSFVVERAKLENNEDYKRLFESRFRLNEVSCGEISPIYGLLDQDGFAQISKLFPNTKLFLVCRNPANRFWSGINWWKTWNKLAVDVEEQACNSLDESEFARLTEYDRICEDATQVFGKERIFLAFYEELFSHQGGSIIKELCNFLEIVGNEPELSKIELRSDYQPLSPELRQSVIKRFRRTYEWARLAIGRLPISWSRDLEAVT